MTDTEMFIELFSQFTKENQDFIRDIISAISSSYQEQTDGLCQ